MSKKDTASNAQLAAMYEGEHGALSGFLDRHIQITIFMCILLGLIIAIVFDNGQCVTTILIP